MTRSRHRSRIIDIVVILAVTLLLVPALGLFQSVRPKKFASQTTPQLFGLPFEPVRLKTADGVSIAGWFIPRQGEPTRAAVIMLHGYPADKGDLLPRAALLTRDFNLLLIDFRYFGESGGSYTTAGAREVDDLLAAVEFLRQRGLDQIGVFGFSMGGAVALMALDRSDAIYAVASEGAYAELGSMTEALYANYGPLKKPLARLTGLYATVFLGIDPFKVSPAATAGRSNRPVLLMHATDDAVVPFQQALLLQQALAGNPRAETVFFAGGHGQSANEVVERLKEFFIANLR